MITAMLPRLFELAPGLLGPLLFSGNRMLHQQTLEAAYKTIIVEVKFPEDCSAVDRSGEYDQRNKVGSIKRLVSDPDDPLLPEDSVYLMCGLTHCRSPHLAQYVRIIHFRHRSPSSYTNETCGRPPSHDVSESYERIRCETWSNAARLICQCRNLCELRWHTVLGMNDEMWKVGRIINLVNLEVH